MAVIKTLLCEFKMGDVEDPELYAAHPLYEWQQTEAGKYCMAKCTESPVFHIVPDVDNFGYKVRVTGMFEEKDYTFWQLKYRP